MVMGRHAWEMLGVNKQGTWDHKLSIVKLVICILMSSMVTHQLPVGKPPPIDG